MKYLFNVKSFLPLCLLLAIMCFCYSCKTFSNRPLPALDFEALDEYTDEDNVFDLDQFKQQIDNLERTGHFDMAYALLERAMQNYYSPELYQYILEHANAHLDILENRDYSKSISFFPKRDSNGRKLNKKKAKNINFQLINKEEARDTAKQYDLCKNNIKLLQKILLKNMPLISSDSLRSSYCKIFDKSEEFKKKLIDSRCNFISYGVISPYLAETEKHLFIAEKRWYKFWKKNTDELYTAIDFIAAPAHKKWLKASNNETRQQFISTWLKMKKLSSKREWEHFQIIVSLSESIDTSRNVGANAWWNE